LRFNEFSTDDLLIQKRHLMYSQQVYELYNNTLRALAARYKMTVAQIDLILWTYSIQMSPFHPPGSSCLSYPFEIIPADREGLQHDRSQVASRLVQGYLANLKDVGTLRRDELVNQLCSLFALIRDECRAFGRNKPRKVRGKVDQVIRALDTTINSREPEQLLAQWNRWHDMVDPGSPNWIGINLPTDMVLAGYLVFEDFLPIKEYVESIYDADSLEPRTASD
jgi:hypothetical protein